MPLVFEEHRLDDLAGGAHPDAQERLRETASAAARLRSGRSAAREAGLAGRAEDGRPRSIVVVGTGAAAAGEALTAVLGNGCPVPVVTVRDHRLPGWVAGYDLVVAVAATSGHETEPVARTAEEAVRRGCRFLAAGDPAGPLAPIAEQARAPFVPLHPAEHRGADTGPAVWGPIAAAVTATGHTGLTPVPEEVFEASAARLEHVAHLCRPTAESWDNPAKSLAIDLAGSLPLIWGATPVSALAARCFAAGLAAEAGYPALAGTFPEALTEQAPVLGGPFGGAGAPRSIFDDPVEETPGRPRVVLLRDPEEPEDAVRAMTGAEESLRSRGVPVSVLSADPGHAMERLAGLIALTDYATVYLAVAYGVDPRTNSLVVR